MDDPAQHGGDRVQLERDDLVSPSNARRSRRTPRHRRSSERARVVVTGGPVGHASGMKRRLTSRPRDEATSVPPMRPRKARRCVLVAAEGTVPPIRERRAEGTHRRTRLRGWLISRPTAPVLQPRQPSSVNPTNAPRDRNLRGSMSNESAARFARPSPSRGRITQLIRIARL